MDTSSSNSAVVYTVVPSIVIVIVAITIAATIVLLVMLYYKNKIHVQGIVLYHNTIIASYYIIATDNNMEIDLTDSTYKNSSQNDDIDKDMG